MRSALEVDRPPQRRERRFGNALRQRRMRMHSRLHLLRRRLEVAADDEFADQLARARPDDVRAQDLAVLLVADDLHEAFRLARRARATARAERERAGLVVETLFLCSLL